MRGTKRRKRRIVKVQGYQTQVKKTNFLFNLNLCSNNVSETKNGGTPITPDEKNPFLMDNSDDDDDAEEEDIREKEEKTESEGFEGRAEFERLATSTACFACDVSTQTPLPAKPCCRIM